MRAVLAACLVLSGCTVDVPEGVYPCDGDDECPAGWKCRPADNRCHESLFDGCGGRDQICCMRTTCEEGLVCSRIEGCIDCGRPNEACCAGNTCSARAICQGAAQGCAACGGRDEPCCPTEDPPCDEGLMCDGIQCITTVRTCGMAGAECCAPPDDPCDTPLICNPKTMGCEMNCGDPGRACCPGDIECFVGFCEDMTCQACGAPGQRCCPAAKMGQPCFDSYCDTGNMCVACGGDGQQCCPGDTCGVDLECCSVTMMCAAMCPMK